MELRTNILMGQECLTKNRDCIHLFMLTSLTLQRCPLRRCRPWFWRIPWSGCKRCPGDSWRGVRKGQSQSPCLWHKSGWKTGLGWTRSRTCSRNVRTRISPPWWGARTLFRYSSWNRKQNILYTAGFISQSGGPTRLEDLPKPLVSWFSWVLG